MSLKISKFCYLPCIENFLISDIESNTIIHIFIFGQKSIFPSAIFQIPCLCKIREKINRDFVKRMSINLPKGHKVQKVRITNRCLKNQRNIIQIVFKNCLPLMKFDNNNEHKSNLSMRRFIRPTHVHN